MYRVTSPIKSSFFSLISAASICLSSTLVQAKENKVMPLSHLDSSKIIQSKSIKIDFNSASLEQLKIPKLVGHKRAAAILAWRDKHGNIKSFDELAQSDDLEIGSAIINGLKKKFYIK